MSVGSILILGVFGFIAAIILAGVLAFMEHKRKGKM